MYMYRHIYMYIIYIQQILLYEFLHNYFLILNFPLRHHIYEDIDKVA